MAVRTDCRHYSSRTQPSGTVLQRCKLEVNETDPFACPDGCPFFEARAVSDAGWHRPPRPEPGS